MCRILRLRRRRLWCSRSMKEGEGESQVTQGKGEGEGYSMGLGSVLGRWSIGWWKRRRFGDMGMRMGEGCSVEAGSVLGWWMRGWIGGGWTRMGEGCGRRSGRYGSRESDMLLLQRKRDGSRAGEGRVSNGLMG